MSDLNNLLERLKQTNQNQKQKIEKEDYPSLVFNNDQSAFNDDNNISFLLNQNNNLKDDSLMIDKKTTMSMLEQNFKFPQQNILSDSYLKVNLSKKDSQKNIYNNYYIDNLCEEKGNISKFNESVVINDDFLNVNQSSFIKRSVLQKNSGDFNNLIGNNPVSQNNNSLFLNENQENQNLYMNHRNSNNQINEINQNNHKNIEKHVLYSSQVVDEPCQISKLIDNKDNNISKISNKNNKELLDNTNNYKSNIYQSQKEQELFEVFDSNSQLNYKKNSNNNTNQSLINLEQLKKEKEEKEEEKRIELERERLKILKEIEERKEKEKDELEKIKKKAEEDLNLEKERIRKEIFEAERRRDEERERILRLEREEEERKEKEFQDLLKRKKEEKEKKEKEREEALKREIEEEETRKREEFKKKEEERKRILEKMEREEKEKEEEFERLITKQKEEREKERLKKENEDEEIRKTKDEEIKEIKKRHQIKMSIDSSNSVSKISKNENMEKQINKSEINYSKSSKTKEIDIINNKNNVKNNQQKEDNSESNIISEFEDRNNYGNLFDESDNIKSTNIKEALSVNNKKENKIKVESNQVKETENNSKVNEKRTTILNSIDNIEAVETKNKSKNNSMTMSPESNSKSKGPIQIQIKKENFQLKNNENKEEEEEVYLHKYYNDKFSDYFQEKVFPFRRRREAYMNDNYFKDYILEEVTVLDKFKSISRRYYISLDQQYDKAISEIDDFNQIFEQYFKLDEAEEYYKEIKKNSINYNVYTSNISPLIKYDQLNDSIFKQTQTAISKMKYQIQYFRSTISNGNSLYLLFFFSCFEYFIFNNKMKEIKKILIDIIKIVSSRFASISKIETFFKIMFLIISSLERKDISKAYSVLLYGINSSDALCQVVDIYYRSIVYLIFEDYIKEVDNTVKISSRKPNESLEENEIDEYNSFHITNQFNEGKKISLQLLPMIFNCNINLTIFDGSYYENNEDLDSIFDNKVSNRLEEVKKDLSKGMKYYTKQFKSMQSSDSNTDYKDIIEPFDINLIYYFSFYMIGYEKDLPKSIQNDGSKVDFPLFELINESGKCEDCQKMKNNKNVVLPFFNSSFCYQCAYYKAEKIISNRASYMNKENYHSREFYTNGIRLNDDIIINEPLFSLLFKRNIGNMLLEKSKMTCFSCDSIKNVNSKSKTDELLILPNCHCQFCTTCLDLYIDKSTYNYVVLSKFDYYILENYHNIKKFLCPCNDTFDIDSAIKLTNKDVSQKRIECKERLRNYVLTICFNCHNQFRKNEKIDYSDGSDFKLVQIIEDPQVNSSNDISNEWHLVCNDCIKQIKELSKTRKNNEESAERKIILCEICKTNHHVETKEWRRVFNPSCSCMIY